MAETFRQLAARMGFSTSEADGAEPWSSEAVTAYAAHHSDRSRIGWAHLPDVQISSAVRMLMRDDLDHEAVVCAARDRICALHVEKAALASEVLRVTLLSSVLLEALKAAEAFIQANRDEHVASACLLNPETSPPSSKPWTPDVRNISPSIMTRCSPPSAPPSPRPKRAPHEPRRHLRDAVRHRPLRAGGLGLRPLLLRRRQQRRDLRLDGGFGPERRAGADLPRRRGRRRGGALMAERHSPLARKLIEDGLRPRPEDFRVFLVRRIAQLRADLKTFEAHLAEFDARPGGPE
jgi:hypothetical protein